MKKIDSILTIGTNKYNMMLVLGDNRKMSCTDIGLHF